jgi:hypothetical protein
MILLAPKLFEQVFGFFMVAGSATFVRAKSFSKCLVMDF